jgi:hypothetical protein
MAYLNAPLWLLLVLPMGMNGGSSPSAFTTKIARGKSSANHHLPN